jgi:type III secretory pathway lipoprotein EscJ
MTPRAQVALAETSADAAEIQAILAEAGIDSELEAAVVHDPMGTDDVPMKVLVDEAQVEAALEAIDAMTEPDELTSD